MGQDDARAAHTLSEILLDDRTTEEKVRGAAKTAPFWVIAIMGHLILAFVFAMVVAAPGGRQGADGNARQ